MRRGGLGGGPDGGLVAELRAAGVDVDFDPSDVKVRTGGTARDGRGKPSTRAWIETAGLRDSLDPTSRPAYLTSDRTKVHPGRWKAFHAVECTFRALTDAWFP
jgi:hypothetical protein